MKVCEIDMIAPNIDPNPHDSERVGVTVVIPCFNEAEGIHDTIAQLLRAQQVCAPRFALRFILVDDASTDDTIERMEAEVAGRCDFEIVKHKSNRGITAAIMTGLAHASTDLVASLDADCTYDPARLIDLLTMISSDTSDTVAMVTASPYHPQGAVENVPHWRLWISGSCSQLYRWVMRTSLHTYTSCFRVYRRDSLLGWQPVNTGFVGLVEMIRMVEERGERTVECPAVLKVRRFGQSKMRILRVASQHLKFIADTLGRRLLNRRETKLAFQPSSKQTIT